MENSVTATDAPKAAVATNPTVFFYTGASTLDALPAVDNNRRFFAITTDAKLPPKSPLTVSLADCFPALNRRSVANPVCQGAA